VNYDAEKTFDGPPSSYFGNSSKAEGSSYLRSLKLTTANDTSILKAVNSARMMRCSDISANDSDTNAFIDKSENKIGIGMGIGNEGYDAIPLLHCSGKDDDDENAVL